MRQPPTALGPGEEGFHIPGRAGVAECGRRLAARYATAAFHQPGFGRQEVAEIVRAGHLPHGFLPSHDRVPFRRGEQPRLQRLPPGLGPAHTCEAKEGGTSVEIEVIGVVVGVRSRAVMRARSRVIVRLASREIGRGRQPGPTALNPRDALPVEVRHQLGAAQASSRDPVPCDQDRKGEDSACQEQPGSRAAARLEEEPSTDDRGREGGQSQVAEQPNRAGFVRHFGVEMADTVGVESRGRLGGCRGCPAGLRQGTTGFRFHS